jgi:putative Mg2+ transporter-C (MgtC) family protein
MNDFLEEFTRPTWLSFPVIAARVAMAALLGGVIGFEREWRNRPAGLRTHILVCVAAAMVGILTLEIMNAPALGGREGASLDPLRAVEAVTAGVAFLAAGTIMFSRGEVQGLTTGAGMWLAGAVGLSAGLGLWQIAALGTLLALAVLGLMYSLPSGIAAEKKDASEAKGAAKKTGNGRGKGPDKSAGAKPST